MRMWSCRSAKFSSTVSSTRAATGHHAAKPGRDQLTFRLMLSVALVGAGYWGPNLARNIAASSATRLSWVCDLDPEAAQRLADRYPGTGATSNYEVVLGDPGVDGIVIATPPVTHQPLVEAALRAGKHVLVEKPLATSSSEARQMCKLADDAGLVLMCDHTFCYTAAVGELRRLLRSGDLGDFLYYDSVR